MPNYHAIHCLYIIYRGAKSVTTPFCPLYIYRRWWCYLHHLLRGSYSIRNRGTAEASNWITASCISCICGSLQSICNLQGTNYISHHIPQSVWKCVAVVHTAVIWELQHVDFITQMYTRLIRTMFKFVCFSPSEDSPTHGSSWRLCEHSKVPNRERSQYWQQRWFWGKWMRLYFNDCALGLLIAFWISLAPRYLTKVMLTVLTPKMRSTTILAHRLCMHSAMHQCVGTRELMQ